jgi:hypothetical protein
MIIDPFDYALPSRGTVGDAILEPILAEGIVPTVVDGWNTASLSRA